MKKGVIILIGLFTFSATFGQDCGKDLKEAFKTKFTLVNESDVFNHFTQLFEFSETELDELASSYESGQELDAAYKAAALF